MSGLSAGLGALSLVMISLAVLMGFGFVPMPPAVGTSLGGTHNPPPRPSINFLPLSWVANGLTVNFWANGTDIGLGASPYVALHVNSVTLGQTVSNPACNGEISCFSLHVQYVFPGIGTWSVYANASAKGFAGYSKVTATSSTSSLTLTTSTTGVNNYVLNVKFNYAQTPGTLTLTFADATYAKNVTIQPAKTTWSFSDGGTATGSSVTHSFAAAGSYSATEVITASASASGTVSNQTTQSVYVSPSTCAGCSVTLQVGFAWTSANLTVRFTDSTVVGNGSIQSQSWNLGDGSTAVGATVVHAYAAPGNYTVNETVVASGPGGPISSTKTNTVLVTKAPSAGCSDNSCAPPPITFTLAPLNGALLGGFIVLGVFQIPGLNRNFPAMGIATLIGLGLGALIGVFI